MKILLATGNAHKLHEIRDMLAIDGLELIGLNAFPEAPDVADRQWKFFKSHPLWD